MGRTSGDSSSCSAALETLLVGRGVTDAGLDLIRRVGSGQPVRSGHSRAGNVTGRYPSRKMGVTIQYESRNVEFVFVILYETDPAVHEYFDQPWQLSLDYRVKSQRRVVVNHTPDFLVLGPEYAGFVECKAAGALPQLAERSPNRYVADGDGGWRCPPGEAAAERYGLGYRVWTPAGVSRELSDNLRFLEAEWGHSTLTFPDEDLARALDTVRAKPGGLSRSLLNFASGGLPVSLSEVVYVTPRRQPRGRAGPARPGHRPSAADRGSPGPAGNAVPPPPVRSPPSAGSSGRRATA